MIEGMVVNEKSLYEMILSRVAQVCEEWEQYGHIVVMTNGCFDLIHPGHANFLRTLKHTVTSLLPDLDEERLQLVVAINSDASVRKLKGAGRPILNERERLEVVSSLRGVDLAFLFDSVRTVPVLRALAPSLLVKCGKGGFVLDPEEAAVLSELEIPYLALEPEFDVSSSDIISRVLECSAHA